MWMSADVKACLSRLLVWGTDVAAAGLGSSAAQQTPSREATLKRSIASAAADAAAGNQLEPGAQGRDGAPVRHSVEPGALAGTAAAAHGAAAGSLSNVSSRSESGPSKRGSEDGSAEPSSAGAEDTISSGPMTNMSAVAGAPDTIICFRRCWLWDHVLLCLARSQVLEM
jgi:hypothetical protein